MRYEWWMAYYANTELYTEPLAERSGSPNGFDLPDLFVAGSVFVKIQRLRWSTGAKGAVFHKAWPALFSANKNSDTIPQKESGLLASTVALVNLAQIKHSVGVLILACLCVWKRKLLLSPGEKSDARSVCVCENIERSPWLWLKGSFTGGASLPSFPLPPPTPSRPPPRPHWFCRPALIW